MSTFFGEVAAPNAGGPFVISLPKAPQGWVSGNIKIGARPNQAISGFSGKMTGANTFEASGENRRGRGMDTVHLAVKITGSREPDGQHVSGKIIALINGVPQKPWTFSAAVDGADPLETPPEHGELEVVWSEDKEYLAGLPSIPTPLKWVAGVGAAIAAAFYAKKRLM